MWRALRRRDTDREEEKREFGTRVENMIMPQKLGWFSGLNIEVLVIYISDFEKTAMNRRHLYHFLRSILLIPSNNQSYRKMMVGTPDALQ